jgi:formylglycine-generating enzyme required for sulfatase activity
VIFCRIPAGRFLMGDEPLQLVETAAYEIGQLPVTNAEFAPFVARGYGDRALWSAEGWAFREACAALKPRFWDDEEWRAYLAPEQPVVGVSFHEAEAFARFAGARLPSEAEWERAARGEDGRIYPWGDEWIPANAAHRGGARHTLPAGSFPHARSPHGLLDCAGNVWEWCAAWYAPGLRSARGGAWNAHPPQLRCSGRNAWPPDARFSNIGFRLAR